MLRSTDASLGHSRGDVHELHISEMRIRNFRNFRSARFRFEQGVNTLIGENGSGKSNALYALRLLIDDGLSRNSLQLRETDFCRHLKDWRGEWIIIAVDFAELDAAEGCQMIAQSAGHLPHASTGTCTLIFRPKLEIRRALFEHTGDRDEINRILTNLTVDDYEPVMTGRSSADFLDDTVYHSVAGSVAVGEFPDPGIDDTQVVGVRVHGVHREVACTSVHALRDVVSDLKGYRNNPLLGLLRGLSTSVDDAKAADLTEIVSNLNEGISGLDEINMLARGIQETLSSAVGHTYGPNIAIESALPDSIDALIQRLTLLVGDPGSSHRGELFEQSLGSANLIYLALKLLEYDEKVASDRAAHFLLIEEPEAHIHTHVQRALFSNLESPDTQIILTTHSTHISSAARLQGMNILARSVESGQVYHPANGLDKDRIVRIERYLDAVRTTLLFAKSVVLVEGDAELIIIPALLKAVFGITPDELGFSVVSMSSAVFDYIADLFHNDRIRRQCAILTDGDKSLLPLSPSKENDSNAESRARRSEALGVQRVRVLQETYDSNPWVEVCPSTYTFEVELFQAGNEKTYMATLPDLYHQSTRTLKSEELLTRSDHEAPLEALRLAAKTGKGWYALLLAEHLDETAKLPVYVRQAVAFACSESITDLTFARMAAHRQRANHLEEGHSMSPAEFCSAYPNDELSLFWTEIATYRNACAS